MSTAACQQLCPHLTQGSFPLPSWPESHITSKSILKGKLIFHDTAVTAELSDRLAFISLYPRAWEHHLRPSIS